MFRLDLIRSAGVRVMLFRRGPTLGPDFPPGVNLFARRKGSLGIVPLVRWCLSAWATRVAVSLAAVLLLVAVVTCLSGTLCCML